ncbi:MAG: hypothetical protein ACP5UI_02350 [Thermoprotei archaeon]
MRLLRRELTLERAIGRELILSGYVASRQTGFKPPNLQRSLSQVRGTRSFIALIYGGMVLLFSLMMLPSLAGVLDAGGRNFGFNYSLLLFSWAGLAMSTTMLPLIYVIFGATSVRDFLLTLPIDRERVEELVAKGLFSSIDVLVYALLGFSLVGSVIVGSPIPTAATALGAGAGLLLVLGLISLVRVRPRGLGRTAALRAVVGVIPLVFVLPLMFSGYIMLHPVAVPEFLSFLPLVSTAYILTPEGAFFALVWLGALAYASYWLMPKASMKLLSGAPSGLLPQQSGKGLRGWTISRSKTLAMVKADFEVAVRSILLSVIIVPIIVFLVFLGDAYSASPAAFTPMVYTLGLENAYLALIVPYAFYALEMRGASVIRLLPLTRLRIALPKVLVLVLFYYLYQLSLVAVMEVKGISLALALPFLVGFLGPAAGVPLTGLMFERTLKAGGAASMSASILYFLAVSIAVGASFAVYFALSLLGYPLVTSLACMLLAGLAELAVFSYLLSRYDR